MPHSNPIRKVTIIPRGMAGGVTIFIPDEGISHMTRSRLKADIVVSLGGRAAEEIVFNEITTGASGDLEQVSRLTRSMVKRFGMSDKLGPMMFGQKEEMIFLGREISEQRDYSEAVAQEIDSEVRAIVSWAYDESRLILNQHRDKLEAVAQRLLEVESLDAEEFLALMGDARVLAKPSEPRIPPTSNTKTQGGTQPQTDESNDRPSLGTAPSPA
jgi:cell division protease FtsH